MLENNPRGRVRSTPYYPFQEPNIWLLIRVHREDLGIKGRGHADLGIAWCSRWR